MTGWSGRAPARRPAQLCRLLYLIGQLRAGGSERQLVYLLQGMDRMRYAPAVAVWNYSESDTYLPQVKALGVPVYPVVRGDSAWRRLNTFRRLVTQLEPEVVHSLSFYTNFAAWWGTCGTPALAVGSVRSDFRRAQREAGRCVGSLSGRWPRTQISNNVAAAAALKSVRSPFAPRDLYVVPNALDLRRFHLSVLPPTAPAVILGIGSLLPVKRWDRVLLAAAELKQRGFSFIVRLAGDGPLRDSLVRRAHLLGIGDLVEFLGHRDDIPDLLAQATLLVHASDSEGCPNVVMEAMASGRAVVATMVGDVSRLVEEGTTGFLVPSGDQRMLVKRLIALLTDAALCRRMGEAARARARRQFGLEHATRSTFAVYRAIGWNDPVEHAGPELRIGEEVGAYGATE